MFRTYRMRPHTTRALHVTADNYQAVADWIAQNIADDRGVNIVHPGTQGQGRPRITFHARDALRHTSYVGVGIPGVLVADEFDDGVHYSGQDVDMFDAQWERT